MPRVLSDNVWVDGVLYHLGQAPPPEVACRIGDHAWTQDAEDDSAEPAQVPVVSSEAVAPEAAEGDTTTPGDAPVEKQEPPRAGRGASRAAWSDYAASIGIDVSALESREDIIAAVDKAQGNA